MKGHKLILHGAHSRVAAIQLINAAPSGSTCTIAPPGRTIDQNSRFWAMLSDVSRAKPEGRSHTPDVWKSLFMAACGHEVQFLMGLDGNPFPHGFKSSRLTKEQMSELIDFIDAWGSERGVEWSEPKEQGE